jgi:hypothetical protein
MEAAKVVIGKHATELSRDLMKVAAAKVLGDWNRISAIYALGFLLPIGNSDEIVSILLDETNSPEIRSHAAEAIGNIRDSGAIPGIKAAMHNGVPKSVVESCEYALLEMDAY